MVDSSTENRVAAPPACLRCGEPFAPDTRFCVRCGLKVGTTPRKKPVTNRDDTLTGLNDQQIERLLDAAHQYEGAQGRGWEIVSWYLRTGCHSDVLAQPDVYHLRLVDAIRSGVPVLIPYWDRTKKQGGDAHCGGFPLQQGDHTWAAGFVGWVKSVHWSTWSYWNAVTEIGKLADLGRDVAPLTLRHTFAYLFLRETRNPWRLTQVMNISLKTATNYLRLVPDDSDEVFVRGLLRPAPKADVACAFCLQSLTDTDWQPRPVHDDCAAKIIQFRLPRKVAPA